ncbi:hypothetical protein [Microcella sp.]|uniref:hypothetical protein n=1 Tax=Microcella sp. TaxID=1913979 RepID=UPI00391946B1
MADDRDGTGAKDATPEPETDTRTRAEKRRDELIEEGILVSMAALRMKVKNRTIVWMLRDGNPWDDAVVRTMVREELAGLADELEREADRLAALRPKAARRIGRSQHQYDYGQEDVYLLRQRENTNRAVAQKLIELGDDDAAVDAVGAGVKHDNLMEIVSASPLPFEPRSDESLDPEQQRRAIRAIEDELQAMLAKAEGRPLVVGASGTRSASATPGRPWWKRLRQTR